ncbi:GDSL-type esterase/lipase family protein [Kribbella sp. NPDC051587]|uniref:GDSL-type esterase/lipase family protein n=1 Tax=Kribbella sp. NPDC051587 TaxID=3364119 RepID=UPI0037A11AF0
MRASSRRSASLLTVATLVLTTLGAAPQPATGHSSRPSPPLHVMQYNLRYASATPPNDWAARRPVMREQLRQAKPDLLGTQEGLTAQLADLANDLGPSYGAIGRGRDGGDEGEHMKVFYNKQRLQALQTGDYWLSDTPDVVASKTWDGCCRRMVTWVKFKDLSSSTQFYAVNTHFEAFDATARSKSADLVLARLKNFDHRLPVIMTGDFNEPAGPASTVYTKLVTSGHLADAWATADEVGPAYGTAPGYQTPKMNDKAIDWILTTPGSQVSKSVVNTFSQNGQYPSDHLPVESWIALRSTDSDPGRGWTGSWAAASAPPTATGTSAVGVTNATLRQVAHLSVGGSEVRIHLSNVYGTSPLVIGKAAVSPRADGLTGTALTDPRRTAAVLFDGKPSVTIPVGTEWISDPVKIHTVDDSDLVISLYLPGPTGPLSQHSRGLSTVFRAAGDQTSDSGSQYATSTQLNRLVLEGVDVKSPVRGSVVLFGDSITDGVASPVDANLRYPDQLFDRLKADQPDKVGVLNAGISGSRLATDAGSSGDSALKRFDRDVIARTGVRTVVLLQGINDIGNSSGSIDAGLLIAVQRQFIERAHQAGLKVIGATLTPYQGAGYYTAEGEADRQALNDFIRNSGRYDAVVDFDRALRDPAAPGKLLPRYDSGDHLHPSAAGYTAMAGAFDLAQLS